MWKITWMIICQLEIELEGPARFDDADLLAFALQMCESLDGNEPQTYKEALNHVHFTKWLCAMKAEIRSLILNKTWILVPLSENCSVVNCKWLFKVKRNLIMSDLRLDKQPKFLLRRGRLH